MKNTHYVNMSSHLSSPPAFMKKAMHLIRFFELCVVVVLVLLMVVVVALSTVELAIILWRELSDTSSGTIINLAELLTLLGYFMMVLIGLELLETIKNYLTANALHVEVVLLVAIIAVARKVIILDMTELHPLKMVGIAALLLGLSGGYWLLKQAHAKFPSQAKPLETADGGHKS